MPGLLLILTEAQGPRAEAGLAAAAASAALGRPVVLLLRDAALDTAPPLLAELQALGVEVAACQTAMAAAGRSAASLAPGVEASGLVALLAGRPDWQLLLA